MSEALFGILRKVTTATTTTMLLKKGIRRCWMSGAKPLVPTGERIVGPAFVTWRRIGFHFAISGFAVRGRRAACRARSRAGLTARRAK